MKEIPSLNTYINSLIPSDLGFIGLVKSFRTSDYHVTVRRGGGIFFVLEPIHFLPGKKIDITLVEHENSIYQFCNNTNFVSVTLF